MTFPGAAAGWALKAMAALVAMSSLAACAGPAGGPDRPLTVVLAPHPDDEIQAWGALPEDREAGDVLVAFLTKGEQTVFCAPELPGYAPGTGEQQPEPVPTGSVTDSCRAARVTSALRFLARMHDTDPAFPVADATPEAVGPLPSGEADLCRHDGDGPCEPVEPAVEVHAAEHGTPVLFFDLGDRDLTAAEVTWAVQAIVDHRDELGLPADRPFGDLVGASYANVDHPACYSYDHPDHVVVSQVLQRVEFPEFAAQVVPVCADTPDEARSSPVAMTIFDAAFAVDGERRLGAHTVEYGWLLDPYWMGDAGPGQSQLFHRDQWFVRAFD